MASIEATIHPAADIQAKRKWRFSLGGLFRVITVISLVMFALVQFGPLAAARDVGLALAIAVAIVACGSRSLKLGLAAGLLAALGFIPTILAAGAPFSERSAVCCECGMTRDVRQVCGWTTKDEILETEASRWAAPMVPANHVHSWQICSDYSRTHWFGSAPIGCGGPREGAPMAWQLARLGDPAGAERAFHEYLDILAGKSPKSMAVHRQEVEDAVNAAVQARR
jgi:hypothetical protein